MAVALLLFAAACTSGGEAAGSASAATDADGGSGPRSGGTLRVGVPTIALQFFDPDLDPQRGLDYVSWELFRCCLLRTLYSYNGKPTDQGGAEPSPDLATRMPDVSNDGLTWTFHLRQGLRYAPPFSDTQVVADDIVRAIERGRNGTVAQYYSVIQGFDAYRSGSADSISGLETPDDHTLVVHLDQAVGDVAYRFSLPATAPIPQAADIEDLGGLLAATGPYMIDGTGELDPTSPADERGTPAGFLPPDLGKGGALRSTGSLTLVRNPSWEPATDALRPAYPDRIEVTLGGEDVQLARRIDGGEVDLTLGESSPREQVARYSADPNMSGRLHQNLNNLEWFVPMNLAVPPFNDVHVRRAVNLAIDKSKLVGIASHPPYSPAVGVTTGEVATHMAPDAFEGDRLRERDAYPTDLARAEEEMRLSAYDRDGDGGCDARACRRVLALVYPIGPALGLARAIKSDLARIGIDLDLELASSRQGFFARTGDPTEQIPISISWGWGTDFPNASNWFSPLLVSEGLDQFLNPSLLGASPAQLHVWGYQVSSVPSVDDRVARCETLVGQQQTECWALLDQYLMDKIVPWVPFFALTRSEVVSERVASYSFDQFGTEPALDRIALVPGSD